MSVNRKYVKECPIGHGEYGADFEDEECPACADGVGQMRTFKGTITETLTVKKEVQVQVEIGEDEELSDYEVEERIKQAIRDKAYEVTVMDGTGWEGVDTESVDVTFSEVTEAEEEGE